MTVKDNYKMLIGSIIPRPIAFITSISQKGIVNAAPFSYFNIVSSNPPLMGVSIGRRDGKMKDTSRNIVDTNQFVVHIIDETIVHEMNKTAATLQEDDSEIDLTSFTLVDSVQVKVPAIKQAKVRMECELEKVIQLGDNNYPSNDLVIGRIVHYHIKEEIYNSGKIDANKLAPVSRLAGHHYANLGEIFEIERPL